MTICINCGVELEDGLIICPLCGMHPGEKDEQKAPVNYPSDVIGQHRKETRKYLWELFGIIAFSGIAACTILDLLISRGLGWSLFSDVSVLGAWIILTLFLYASKRPVILIPGLMLTILAGQLAIDLIGTEPEWFFPVGLPVTTAAFCASGIVTALYRKAHFTGLNLIASAIVLFSGFFVLTEIILDKFSGGPVDLRWSLIIAVSILPVALILFFYHYRLKKGNRLDSFFHI